MRLAACGRPAAALAAASRMQQPRRLCAPLVSPMQPRYGRELALDVQARDGKKRRKPQQQGGSGSFSEEEAPQPAPRRVDPNSLMSIRLQQKFAKMNKEYDRVQREGYRRKPPPPQGYRRETVDPEEYRRQKEEKERIDAEIAKQKSDMITLQNMFHTGISAPGERPRGVALVDGYNLLFKWRRSNPHIEELMGEAEGVAEGALERARQYLLRSLDVYSHQAGMFVHVAFDAMGRGYSSQHNTLGMIVNYTGREEADTFIMRQAREYIGQGVQHVCIVSDDLEVATLGPGSIEYKSSDQAVTSCSCFSLIKLIAKSQATLADELDSVAVQYAAPASLVKIAEKHRSRSGGGGSSSGGRAASGIKSRLLDLQQGLMQQEAAAAEAARQKAREERRQARQEAQAQALAHVQAQALEQQQQEQQAEEAKDRQAEEQRLLLKRQLQGLQQSLMQQEEVAPAENGKKQPPQQQQQEEHQQQQQQKQAEQPRQQQRRHQQPAQQQAHGLQQQQLRRRRRRPPNQQPTRPPT